MVIKKSRVFFAILLLIIGITPVVIAQEQKIRIATYNIEWFGGKPSSQERIQRLKSVIEKLNADVIGLQEIKDRATLRQIFASDKWQIVIDDQSNENQDVALAVRLPFKVMSQNGNSSDIDADDGDFLFPSDTDENEWFFPDQRDILFVKVKVPNVEKPFIAMVHHAKSRSGGRKTTEPRREGAAVLIVQAIEHRLDGEDIILLGDFNDNPDDQSLNILETGREDADPGPDDTSDDSFLLNLTQSLLNEDYVSWGLSERNIINSKLDTRILGSRKRNNDTRGTQGVISPILFDQILITPDVLSRYTLLSVKVFDDPIAQEGHVPNGHRNANKPINYASDHTPVVAEFVVGSTSNNGGTSPQPSLPKIRIIELLPNPIGDDSGHETVTLSNFGDQDISLTGWKFVDKAGNEFTLSGTLKKGERQTITLPKGSLPLNNSGGDEVTLLSEDGNIEDRVRYSGAEAKEGVVLKFGS